MTSAQGITQAAQPPATDGRAARLVLFLTVFVDLLGFGIVIPFLPMFARKMGVGAVGIGMVLSTYSLMQLICAPVLGRISDRIGRRPIIMIGLAGSSIGYLMYGFAGSFATLLLSRAIHGACAATISTAQAYVADTTTGEDRAKGMGLIGAAFGLGFVLGPAIGGLLGLASLRVPVFFSAVLCTGNFVFAAMKLPESHPPHPGAKIELARIAAPIIALPRELIRHRLSEMFAAAFAMTFALASLEATFALMIPRVYGYGAAGVGALLALAGVAQAIAQGYLLGKIVKVIGELTLVRIGLVAMIAGLAPMGSIASHTALFAMLVLLSAGYGFASPSIASLISRNTAHHHQGEVLGVSQSAQSLARIVGPLAGGMLYEIAGAAAPYVIGAIAAAMALALTARFKSAPAEGGTEACFR